VSKLFEDISKLQKVRQESARQKAESSTGSEPAPPAAGREPFSFFILGLLAGMIMTAGISYLWFQQFIQGRSLQPVTQHAFMVNQAPERENPTTAPVSPGKESSQPLVSAVLQDKTDTPAKEIAPTALRAENATRKAAASGTEKSPDKTGPAIPGKYPEASTRLLTRADLKGKPASELQIMRNEIYARHSLIFESRNMREYFGGQTWYIPKTKNVRAKLSQTEIANIELIKNFK